MRAVDAISSFDFVDADRICTIGHSMGSAHANDVLLFDDRVRACVVSGAYPNEWLPLNSPRLHLAIRGRFDGLESEIREVEESYRNAMRFYEVDGAEERLHLSVPDCGHHFLEEFRWGAYARLREYFGLQMTGRHSLTEIVAEARMIARWCWEGDESRFPEVTSAQPLTITADRDKLVKAFGSLFAHLFDKGTRVMVELQETISSYDVLCRVPATGPGAHYDPKRLDAAITSCPIDRKGLFDHDATIEREYDADEIRYVVRFARN